MAHGFVREDNMLETRLEPLERAMLRQLLEELCELIEADEREDQPSNDPLARELGLQDLARADVEAPDDPVLARLLPDGYTNDPDAANEFRRYTDSALRRGKRADADEVLAGLERADQDPDGTVWIDEDSAMAWLRSLNDLRLALGVQLELTAESAEQLGTIPDDDPRAASAAIYEFLTWWQDTLVSALMD